MSEAAGGDNDAVTEFLKRPYKMNEADCGTMLGFERQFESSVFKAETDQDVAKWHTCAQGEACGE